MTTSDITSYRTTSLKAKAWLHVVLCDRALGEPASIIALTNLSPEDRRDFEHLPQADAKQRLNRILTSREG